VGVQNPQGWKPANSAGEIQWNCGVFIEATSGVIYLMESAIIKL
jgi:hypothetical protein